MTQAPTGQKLKYFARRTRDSYSVEFHLLLPFPMSCNWATDARWHSYTRIQRWEPDLENFLENGGIMKASGQCSLFSGEKVMISGENDVCWEFIMIGF